MSEDSEVLLEVSGLKCRLDKEQSIFHDVNFEVREGDVLILQGKSGSGKSTLLKCLAHLNVYDGEIRHRGKTPKEHGIPVFRLSVLYVPQRPSLLPGTPRDFLHALEGFGAYKAHVRGHPDAGGEDLEARATQLASGWGVEDALWDRTWPTLSGGEAQRVALAAAIALGCAEVVLLDEPTSALDSDSSSRIERELTSMVRASDNPLKALVWITHSPEQAQRVGTRFLEIKDGTCQEVLVNDAV